MSVDYRIYCSVYALCAVLWLGALIPLSNANPGKDTFRIWMRRTNLMMGGTLVILTLTGVTNFLDWLWS